MGTGLLDSRPANELLCEFVSTGDQAPFEEIVRRYAGMVYHVCLQVTRNTHDAEDATQAVFLTLAVQAKSTQIRAIGPWLQQVAYRLSLDMRKSKKRRALRENRHSSAVHSSNGGHAPPADRALDLGELKGIVSEELDQLPPKYRLPLILHYYGGLSREEIARELHCKPSTLGVRLHRAREMLARRLSGRGLVLPAGVAALAMAQAVHSSIWQSLISPTSHAAAQLAAGHAVSGHLISEQVMALVRLSAKAVFYARFKMVAVMVLAAGSALAAGAQVVQRVRPADWLHLRQDLKDKIRLQSPLPKLRVETPPSPVEEEQAGQQELAQLSPMEPVLIPAVRGEWVPWVASNGLAAMEITPASRGVAKMDQWRPEFLSWPAPMAGGQKGTSAIAVPVIPGVRPMIASNWSDFRSSGGSGGAPTSDGPLQRFQTATHDGPTPSREPPVRPAPQPSPPPPDHSGTTPIRFVGVVPQTPSPTPPPPPIVGLSLSPIAAVTHQQTPYNPSPWGNIIIGPWTSDVIANSVGVPRTAYDYTVSHAGGSVEPETTWTRTDQRLQGHGQVPLAGAFNNSGQVVADGRGADRDLDLSSASAVINTIDNPRNGGVNGWYARSHGRLVLPPVAVHTGDTSVTWGDDPAGASIDLVNSVRLTFAASRCGGDVSLALLAPDRVDYPHPAGTPAFLSIWSLDAGHLRLDDANVTIRYDAEGLFNRGLGESTLALWRFDGRWERVTPVTLDTDANLISGRLDDATRYFALSSQNPYSFTFLSAPAIVTPEPSMAVLAGAALGLLALRRRRRPALGNGGGLR